MFDNVMDNLWVGTAVSGPETIECEGRVYPLFPVMLMIYSINSLANAVWRRNTGFSTVASHQTLCLGTLASEKDV